MPKIKHNIPVITQNGKSILSFIKSVLQFLVFGFCFYIVFIILSGCFLPDFFRRNLVLNRFGGFTAERLAEADSVSQKDILILGSSRAYRGFDPRLFDKAGYSIFNLGTSNQTPIQSLYLLQKYAERLRPKVVIFEVNPDIFSNDGVESSVDIISNSTFSGQLFSMALDINHIKTWNAFIFSAFTTLTSYNVENKAANNNPALSYISGGFAECLDTNYYINNGNSYLCSLSEQQLDAYHEIETLLQVKSIQLIKVQAPIAPKLYETCEENTKFNSIMDVSGIYYNFNLIAPIMDTMNTKMETSTSLWDTQYFVDGQHLNQKGVRVFNKKVVELLKNDRTFRK